MVKLLGLERELLKSRSRIRNKPFRITTLEI